MRRSISSERRRTGFDRHMAAYIYLDNGATSHPKAPGVADAAAAYLNDIGANINRGTYGAAASAALTVLETRERLAALFHFGEDIRQVILTPGVTFSLNQVIRGWLRPGDHAIVSSLEHNAVMRPLNDLSSCGVSFDRIPAGRDGITRAGDILPLIRANTRLVVVSHASNVCGALFPLRETAEICAQYGIPLAVDAAQTAGHEEIDFDALRLSALCVPGHKGLLGPQGVGAMLLSKGFADRLRPIVSGGTGSASHSEAQPELLPDKFESGTMNLPGIYGLNAALAFIGSTGVETLRRQEKELTGRFLRGIGAVPGVKVAGPGDAEKQVGVIALDFTGLDNAEAAFALERDFGVITRCGLHCAPNAHKVLGTYPQGAVRFSFGFQTTPADVDAAVAAVATVADR